MSKLNEVEKTMIEIAYDSWLFAVATHQDNELIAHHAKRFKYLIDWIGTTLEIETERKQDGLNILA
jgi:hypothetical protein